jgi:hypothetical protein
MKIYTFEPSLKRIPGTSKDEPDYKVDIVLSDVIVYSHIFDYPIKHAGWEESLIKSAMNKFAERLQEVLSQ